MVLKKSLLYRNIQKIIMIDFGPQKPFLDRFHRSAALFASRGTGPINQVDSVSNSDRENQILDDMRIQDIARGHIAYRSQGEYTSKTGSRCGKRE